MRLSLCHYRYWNCCTYTYLSAMAGRCPYDTPASTHTEGVCLVADPLLNWSSPPRLYVTDHPYAGRTAPGTITYVGAFSYGWWYLGSHGRLNRQWLCEAHPNLRQFAPPVTIGQETVVADAHQTLRKNMQ